MDIAKSIIGHGTISLKEVNQDYSLAFYSKELNCNVVVVADGLGSFLHSEKASKFACENLIKVLDDQLSINNLNFNKLFQQISDNLRNHFNDLIQEMKGIENILGTTLICCIESEEEFVIAYVGNGGAFHIKGNFNQFPERYYLPWSSINLLNPHSIEEQGKNAMYKLIEPNSTSIQITPSVVKLSKDNFDSGDILMICTDGIYSFDEVQIGKDSNGKIWISGEDTMKYFYKHLNSFFKLNEWNSFKLKDSISQYLEELRLKKMISDDATLALLISGQTIFYQSKITQANSVKKEELTVGNLISNEILAEKECNSNIDDPVEDLQPFGETPIDEGVLKNNTTTI